MNLHLKPWWTKPQRGSFSSFRFQSFERGIINSFQAQPDIVMCSYRSHSTLKKNQAFRFRKALRLAVDYQIIFSVSFLRLSKHFIHALFYRSCDMKSLVFFFSVDDFCLFVVSMIIKFQGLSHALSQKKKRRNKMYLVLRHKRNRKNCFEARGWHWMEIMKI